MPPRDPHLKSYNSLSEDPGAACSVPGVNPSPLAVSPSSRVYQCWKLLRMRTFQRPRTAMCHRDGVGVEVVKGRRRIAALAGKHAVTIAPVQDGPAGRRPRRGRVTWAQTVCTLPPQVLERRGVWPYTGRVASTVHPAV